MAKIKTITVGEKEYKLVLKTSGIIAVEDKLGENIMDEVIRYQQGLSKYADRKGNLDLKKVDKMPVLSTKYCATVIYGSLQKYNHGFTFAKTLDLIDDYLDQEGNNNMTLFSLVMELLQISGVMPTEEELQKDKEGE